ncbi:hypothetical protein KY327_00180 [Candidatus Woesearchaeota archaeon]|nr:hypothetical protein [Candidatus Woesearchaeota archaeon]
MKQAIAADSKDAEAMVSDRAGRAPYYLIYEDGEIVEAWKNPFAVGGGGAGWSVAHKLAEKGVRKVVAGRIGGNFVKALEEKSVDYEERPGEQVKDVL